MSHKTHVIYHANCIDGFTAAWIASKELGVGELVFHPATYGSAPPEMADGDPVYILDFSYPREVILAMKEKHSVILLDHHKTARDELADIKGCFFDMMRSGAGVTWDWFNLGKPRPGLINYVEDRDLWTFRLTESKAVNAYIRVHKHDFRVYNILAEEIDWDLPRVIEKGRLVLRTQEIVIDEQVARHYMSSILGNIVPIANATAYFSETAERLLSITPAAKFAAVYFDLGNGLRQWSLRSRSDFDVSEIAKYFGGGGHPQAAGFSTVYTWVGDEGKGARWVDYCT